ncbi:Hypothetical protein FKW44_007090 [Caligus rogercresseyi]|uniref:Uncharacterized protein n=1 Tax=Caligus rogercresseyi TaxID=217165 RepID=A0A7T8KED6_CALRO|nr:Hypothetical protein FKW44_007090 [Caligus rogercresseyi]
MPDIFTDGSKMNDGVGFGWCITFGDQSIQEGCGNLNWYNTVFQAEWKEFYRQYEL